MYLPPPTLIETRKLKTHPNNPRYIRKDKLENLKKSITEDPDYMQHRALLVNPQMEVFAGNQRLRLASPSDGRKSLVTSSTWTKRSNGDG